MAKTLAAQERANVDLMRKHNKLCNAISMARNIGLDVRNLLTTEAEIRTS